MLEVLVRWDMDPTRTTLPEGKVAMRLAETLESIVKNFLQLP
jgi:hypothetical protein